MYLKGIVQYLTWPLLILVSWFAVKAGLYIFEKKFSEPDKTTKGSGADN